MKCDQDGLTLNKSELTALLEFCSRDYEGQPELCVVKFTVRANSCYAYATDGRRAVEAAGDAHPDSPSGEWLVRREELQQAKRMLERKQVARLAFSGASLHEAKIEESGLEVADLGWPKDAAIAQHSLPGSAPHIRLPHASEQVARCAGINARAYAAIRLLARAAGKEVVDQYPSRTPDAPSYYQVQEETVWTAMVLPQLTEESTGTGKRKRKSTNARQLEIEPPQQQPEKSGATVTPITAGGSKRASKRGSKKKW